MAMSGAFSSTPTAALVVLFDVAPLHIHLKQEALSCTYRLRVLGLLEETPVNRTSTHTSLFPLLVNWDKIVLAPSDLVIFHIGHFPRNSLPGRSGHLVIWKEAFQTASYVTLTAPFSKVEQVLVFILVS